MKKIYTDYAFTENNQKKLQSNLKYVKTIKDKATTEIIKHARGHNIVRVFLKEDVKLEELEIALIADNGHLPFGYTNFRKISDIEYEVTIFTD